MSDEMSDSVIAGSGKPGKNLTQLNNPTGVIVDNMGTVYVADSKNHRVMRWFPGEAQGTIIAGGAGFGRAANQLNEPVALSFDREGNLYVVDRGNNRVQKFILLST